MDVPWWALSPSPFSIIFYLILTLYITKKLCIHAEYKRFKHLTAFTDAIFIVGFFVVSLDFIWIIICYLRFSSMYPDSSFNLIVCAGRDLAAVLLCYLFTASHFKNKLIKASEITWILLSVNIVFLATWFFLSPTPAYTDWTFGIRHDYPLSTILTSFLTSHIIGKSLVVGIIYTSISS